MAELKRSWYGNNSIYPEHAGFPVRQVYLWFLTRDGMVVVVENKSNGIQLPGGKPEGAENPQQTLQRELQEECGIELEKFVSTPQMIGYYLMENDPVWPDSPVYLQLRYLLKVDSGSLEIGLQVNEAGDGQDNVRLAKFVRIKSLTDHIPYMYDLAEYKIALGLSY